MLLVAFLDAVSLYTADTSDDCDTPCLLTLQYNYHDPVLLLSTPCLLPLQYNYLENFPGAYNDAANSYQSLSYSGDGDAATRGCGCQVCPDRPCGLGRSGPAPGPLKTDTRAPPGSQMVSAGLEACAGSSGNCMTINGRDCCMAVNSYQYSATDAGDACTARCDNWWSAISVARPLTALWGTVQQTLPYTP